jgi:hypothetical protein
VSGVFDHRCMSGLAHASPTKEHDDDDVSRKLQDALLSGVESPEDLLGDKGLMKELKIRLMGRMLGADLTEHLHHEPYGEPAASVPIGAIGRAARC